MKIAVIGGGNMGRAISFGAISTGFIDPKFVRISDPSEDVHKIVKDFNPSIQLFKDSKEAIKGVDLIIVAVKPWLLKEVLEEISNDIDRNKQGLVSIVAGAKFEQISSYLGGALKKLSLYRVIPNTAVSLGIGTSFISSFNTRTEVTEMVFALFSSIGATFKTAEEDM